jgi:hypothetical protein
MGTFAEANCTVTQTAQNLPWTATATNTTNIQIHGVDVNVLFENTPGNPTACALPTTWRVTGTLTGGSWNAANNELFFQHDDGLTIHTAQFGSSAFFVTGTIRDTSGTLRVFD